MEYKKCLKIIDSLNCQPYELFLAKRLEYYLENSSYTDDESSRLFTLLKNVYLNSLGCNDSIDEVIEKCVNIMKDEKNRILQ